MNFNIYLNDDIARQLDNSIRTMGISRSKAISKALSLWFREEHKEWSDGFFSFDNDHGFPDVIELRDNINDDFNDPLK
ncbi:MAG: CopG family transcriptional regulator [Rickettsiales bacterium]|nr:MAG: CopG family transcriptional regulator [Rickettsiales bacterium]